MLLSLLFLFLAGYSLVADIHAAGYEDYEGVAYLDKKEPYKSFVGKIIPDKQGSKKQPDPSADHKKMDKLHRIPPKHDKIGVKGRKQRARGRTKALAKSTNLNDAQMLAMLVKQMGKDHDKPKNRESVKKSDENLMSSIPPAQGNPNQTKNATVMKGRALQAADATTSNTNNSTANDTTTPEKKPSKASWFFKNPSDRIGQTVVNYDPSDPKAPQPAEILKYATRSAGKKKKPEVTGNVVDTRKRKPQIIHYPDTLPVDPDAPGWFSLKGTSEYGKELKLGTLLRKKGNQTVETKPPPADFAFRRLAQVESSGEDEDDDDASEKWPKKLRQYDKACLWQEYMAAKSSLVGPKLSEMTREKVRWQNERLSHFFLDLVFKVPVDGFQQAYPHLYQQEPKNSFILLQLTKEIFTKFVCKDSTYDSEHYNPKKDKILPNAFTETIFHLFLKLYELTRNKQASEYLSEKEMYWIKGNLESCLQPGYLAKKIEWFTEECKETVIAFDQPNNYVCTPYIEYDFNIKKYDPLLDFVWHMIASVHSHCFESFQSNPRMWHKYALTMADLFTADMRIRWLSSSEDSKKLYTRLFGPHYDNYFNNANRCMFAATLRSNVPYLLPRFEGNRGTRFAPSQFQQFNVTEF